MESILHVWYMCMYDACMLAIIHMCVYVVCMLYAVCELHGKYESSAVFICGVCIVYV